LCPMLLQSSSDVDLSGLLVKWWVLRIELFPSSSDADLGGPLHPRSGRWILVALSASSGSQRRAVMAFYELCQVIPLCKFLGLITSQWIMLHTRMWVPLTLIFYRF
jgi:hypothetical protein